MPFTSAQLARNRLAYAVHRGDPPEVIAQARADLEYAKAEQAVASWSHLAVMQRARLAAQLLAGDDDAIAT
jgi:hypothetical protein